METIETLKQAAREREAQSEARAAADQKKIEDRLESLRTWLAENHPLGMYAVEFAAGVHGKQLVTFEIPSHAPLTGAFDDLPHEKTWYSTNLTSDGYSRNKWRVEVWTGTRYDAESESFYAETRSDAFEDLGDALLYAERNYTDPAEIQREIDEKNDRVAAGLLVPGGYAGTVSSMPPAPEPTNAEILVDAFKNFVQEQILIAREFA